MWSFSAGRKYAMAGPQSVSLMLFGAFFQS